MCVQALRISLFYIPYVKECPDDGNIFSGLCCLHKKWVFSMILDEALSRWWGLPAECSFVEVEAVFSRIQPQVQGAKADLSLPVN